MYALMRLGVYSAIPYKTPWLILGFLHAGAILAGWGAVRLIELAAHRRLGWGWAVGLVLAAGIVQQGLISWRTNGRMAARQDNPYVYSHTTPDLLRFLENVREAARFHPDGRSLVLKVMTPEYWPLPWYLRDFSNVGYWSGLPEEPEAPIMITTPEEAERLRPRLEGDYVMDFGGLRHGYVLAALIREDLWDAMLRARSRREGS